jgi:hypothetical protein
MMLNLTITIPKSVELCQQYQSEVGGKLRLLMGDRTQVGGKLRLLLDDPPGLILKDHQINGPVLNVHPTINNPDATYRQQQSGLGDPSPHNAIPV